MADPEYREQGGKWWMKAGGGGWKKVDAEEVPDVKLSKAGVPPTGSEPAIAAAASLNEKPTTKSPAAPVAMAGLGALVWGKVGRHPWWPATIIELGKKTSTKKTVRFFGDESKAQLTATKIRSWGGPNHEQMAAIEDDSLEKAIALAEASDCSSGIINTEEEPVAAASPAAEVTSPAAGVKKTVFKKGGKKAQKPSPAATKLAVEALEAAHAASGRSAAAFSDTDADATELEHNRAERDKLKVELAALRRERDSFKASQ